MFFLRTKFFIISAVFSGIAIFLLSADNFLLAQSELDIKCEWANIEQGEASLSREDFRALLEQCKKYYEDKNVQLGKEIGKTAQEKKTQASQIANLQNKIKTLGNQIAQSNLIIKDLELQISNTQLSIGKTSEQIEGLRISLTNLLQLRYEEDQRTLVEIFLAEKQFSDFFSNLIVLDNLNSQVQNLLKNIKNLKLDLEDQKSDMDSEKKDLENVVVMQTLQKNDSAKKKSEEEYLLKLTEKDYQKYLQERKDAQDKVSKIGSLLFELLEVPEGGISVEDAIAIAKEAGKLTGIRPAFSLGVLWQETRIGKLKGGCYLKNTSTGEGIYIKSGNKAPRTMNPKARSYEKNSDVYYFLEIVKGLNESGKLKTDPYTTAVSCCMIKDGSYFGWGGAMGPAQFIPNTWMLYKGAVEQKSGSSPANPWNIRDAFLANALYLKDLGAKNNDYTTEMRAALKYFGCTTSWCETYYGRPVMTVASCFQQYIDKNSMSVDCKDLIF
ncbi:hypothetical protein COT20_02200 [bacterium (Candidatus Gribaldobacteria) CG08_land_8_20_14_0_20_39_15]|uniref:Transglycosylase SLT domain-containing protein n=1 Tax=bacterium (Candidatus Gribaldobacteria) CG08_land_8_20_14_0_20_39_15 TaxID=2014273 RepID=A0A2M6XUC9_9BACT|nr:MAG: hypothetical protein COT20_02200 [bacterium (Candidatus Gribaldobacteria) CG08_land_8_20_14_0_20_39_15]